MSHALSGWTAVITRPRERAADLAARVVRARGKVMLLPAIEIGAVDDDEPSLDALTRIDRFDLAIFTSIPAVEHAHARRPDAAWPASVLAVGPRTQMALKAHGIVAHSPGAGADSEAVLADPALSRVAGRKIVIVCAPGGRAVLANTLVERGAKVEILHVYQRVLPAPGPEAGLPVCWETSLMTATSVQILDNLSQITRRVGLMASERPLAVASERIARRARELGYQDIAVAEGADDLAMVSALVQLAGIG